MADESTQAPKPVGILRSMGGLVFDAVFEETHQSELEVTDNPVETGVVVSDHAYMKPVRVTLSAGVSETPLATFTATTDKFASATSRSQRAFDVLTDLQKKAEPFDLQTGLRLYKNMICTSIRTSQDKDTAGALVFEAELREVLIVKTKVVKYTRLPTPKAGAPKRQAGAKKDKGEQQSTEVTDPSLKQLIANKIKAALSGK